MDTLFAVGSPILTLFVYALVGFILRKFNVLTQEGSAVVSRLLVNVFMPCLTFNTISKHLTVENVKTNYVLLLVSSIWVIGIYAIAVFVAKGFTKDKYEQYVYRYAITCANFGGVSYPLMYALYGEEMLFQFMLFTLPVNIFAYTEGYRILTDSRKINLKFLLSPVIIASFLGMAFGLCTIKPPAFIVDILQTFGDMNGAMSMLMIGLVIGEYNVKELFKDKKAYIVSAIRLIVIPALLFLLLWAFNAPKRWLIFFIMLVFAHIGSLTITFPRTLGKDCLLGARMVTVSAVFSVFTMFGFALLLRIV